MRLPHLWALLSLLAAAGVASLALRAGTGASGSSASTSGVLAILPNTPEVDAPEWSVGILPSGARANGAATDGFEHPELGAISVSRRDWQLEGGRRLTIEVTGAEGGRRRIASQIAGELRRAGPSESFEPALVRGAAALVQNTADERGPGLWIITWAPSADTGVQLIGPSTLPLTDLLDVADSIEVSA